MDEATFKTLFEFKKSGKVPQGLSRNDKIVFLRKAKNFIIENEVLNYIKKRGVLAKVVKSKKKAEDLFKEFHSSSIGAHCGVHKTLDAINKRFYWPGMSVDIKKWVTHCGVCQKKRTSLKNQTEYTPIVVAEPWEVVGMDLVGKLAPTKDGYQYICVMVDYFSKWCEAFPLKSKRAEEVTDCIVQLFYKFGAPKRILTDQGTEFVNKINLGVCQMLGIKRSLCAPYHPQTNGLVEKLNGTIQKTLSKLVEKRPDTWSDYLDAAMFGLRTKKQLTTNFSPYFLLFGREARYPCEVPDTYEINESVEEMIALESISESINRQDRIYKIVKENMARVQTKIQKRKLQQGKPVVMQVGDRVIRQNIRSQQRKGGKLDPDYVGPFTVVKVDGKSINLLDDSGKQIPKVNADQLKHFLEDPPPKQPKITTVTTTSLPASVPVANYTISATTQLPSLQTPFTPIRPVTLPIAQLFLNHLTAPATMPIVMAHPQIISIYNQMPAASPASQLAASPASQPAASPASQPAVPPASQPAVPPASQPAASQPAVPPASQPAVPPASQPAVPPASQPAVPPASQPAVPPASQPAVPPASQPAVPPASQPAVPPASQPAVPPASQPAVPPASQPAVPPASQPAASQITLLQDIWAGKVGGRMCSKIGPYKLFTWDLERLRPGMMLESEVINAYLTCLANSYAGKAFVIDSFEMTNIWDGKGSSMKRMDPRVYDVMLGSVNEGKNHWTLLMIYPQKGRIIYMNSFGESHRNVVHSRNAVRCFMNRKGFHNAKWDCVTLPHSLQADGNSCGVFVCKFAEAILTGGDLNFACKETDIALMRDDIGQRLLKESEELDDLCLACGNKNSHAKGKMDTWIQCDSCSGWYHWDCMSRPKLKAVFICPACKGPIPHPPSPYCNP